MSIYSRRGLWTAESAAYSVARLCILGCGGSSTSQSSNTTNNDNSVTDNRIGLDGGSTAIGEHANVAVDSHNVSTVDSHNVTNVTDGGIVKAGFEFGSSVLDSLATTTTAGLNAAADVSNRALASNTTVATDALMRMESVTTASLTAQQRTAETAIDAIRSDASDSRALARSLGSDVIQFSHDIASGFVNASSDLNKIVGSLSKNNDEFLTTATDKILARSQSADQQNFEATLNMLKWVAGAIALAFVVPRLVKGAA